MTTKREPVSIFQQNSELLQNIQSCCLPKMPSTSAGAHLDSAHARCVMQLAQERIETCALTLQLLRLKVVPSYKFFKQLLIWLERRQMIHLRTELGKNQPQEHAPRAHPPRDTSCVAAIQRKE